MMVNTIRNYRRQRQRRPTVDLDRAEGFLERPSNPNDDLVLEWDRDHDAHVVQKPLVVVQRDLSSTA